MWDGAAMFELTPENNSETMEELPGRSRTGPIMSQSVTDRVTQWRTAVIARIAIRN